jgi:hemoglobin
MSENSTEISLYEQIGGAPTLKKLVDAFYRTMDIAPEAKDIRDMHAPDLSEANQKLFEFLSGWMGGPSLYIEKHGHPRLRARHLPFKIGMKERDQWLFCFHQALIEIGLQDPARRILWHSIGRLADHMRNQNETGPSQT